MPDKVWTMSAALSCELRQGTKGVLFYTRILMPPAESNLPKFHKWQFVKRFGSDPKAVSWAREYAALLEVGGKFRDSTMPFEVWASLAASTSKRDKANKLAEYLSK